MKILITARMAASLSYHEKIFQTTQDWENIYMLPRNTALDNIYHMF